VILFIATLLKLQERKNSKMTKCHIKYISNMFNIFNKIFILLFIYDNIMGDLNSNQINLKIILSGFLLSCLIIVATTPIHEGAHWIMSELDPYIEPVEFHLFDDNFFNNGQHILSSSLGYVVVQESYPGAFDDRPIWADLLQEIICIFIQIILTCIIVSKLLTIIFDKKKSLTYKK
jgi:hypothetical protein